LITVLILDASDTGFDNVLGKNRSRSFMPVSLNNNILGIVFSWVNSYFSLDKIFVVCSNEEQEDVKTFCKGIYEENMIIEPERKNFSVSVFYATLFLGKIFPDETVFFIPVSFMFHENFKFGNFLFAADEMTEKNRIVIPSLLLNKDDRESEYLDAGKQICNVKGIDFFNVEHIISGDDLKKRKMFGKYGKMLKIIAGKHRTILDSFLVDEKKEFFIKKLSDYFNKDEIEWEYLNEEYKNNSVSMNQYNFFAGKNNFLTMFIETEPYVFDNWLSILSRFGSKNDGNLVCGNVKVKNCKSVICLNYEEDNIELYDMQEVVVIKKDRKTIMEKID
jgi:mannose-1-phosphate guanylyltransferase